MTVIIAASFNLASDSSIFAVRVYRTRVAVWREWERYHKAPVHHHPGGGVMSPVANANIQVFLSRASSPAVSAAS